jgi:hypothetical protein
VSLKKKSNMTESDMTEFEELERIESAIESKNKAELQ